MRLHRPVSNYLERRLETTLYGELGSEDLFLAPPGEPALVPADGLTAEIYSLPLTVFIGGIAAVILELAEPRVRHGVWDHSIFPTDPLLRLRRTGLAAMVTFYGARSVAKDMIAGINQRHTQVAGITSGGEAYRADDPELLKWVQATAAFGFTKAYARYVRPLGLEGWEQAMTEAVPVAKAYGVDEPPRSRPDIERLFGRMVHRLEPSETLSTFLNIMRKTPALPPPGLLFQPLFVRAAVDLLPMPIRRRLDLIDSGLTNPQRVLVRALARGSQRVSLRNHPANLQRQRLGFDANNKKAR